MLWKIPGEAWDLPICEPCNSPGELRYFPSGHTQLAVLWEAVAHSQLAFVDRNSFTLAFATPFFFQKNQSIDLCGLHDALVEPSSCPLLLIKFGISKNPPSTLGATEFWEDSKKTACFPWYVPTYVGSVQTCNAAKKSHLMHIIRVDVAEIPRPTT